MTERVPTARLPPTYGWSPRHSSRQCTLLSDQRTVEISGKRRQPLVQRSKGDFIFSCASVISTFHRQKILGEAQKPDRNQTKAHEMEIYPTIINASSTYGERHTSCRKRLCYGNVSRVHPCLSLWRCRQLTRFCPHQLSSYAVAREPLPCWRPSDLTYNCV